SPVRSGRFRPVFKVFFWLFVANCFVLGVVGGNPAEGFWIPLSQASTAYYFGYFLIILPLLGMFEKPLALPASISEAVVGKGHSPVPEAAE
ncbi:MAG: cytochrome b, partial [Rhodospirillales bacterium]